MVVSSPSVGLRHATQSRAAVTDTTPEASADRRLQNCAGRPADQPAARC